MASLPFARGVLACLLCLPLAPALALAQTGVDAALQGADVDASAKPGFVAKGDGVGTLLAAVAAQMQLPAVISAKAQKKRVQGRFDLKAPRQLLQQLSADLALVWYSDGQSLYVYDASEIRNAVGHMEHASVTVLNDFLRRTQLADPRFAVRGTGADGTFYVSGPPVYVDIVLNAARYLDVLYRDADERTEHVEVIHLRHSFVQGRRYGLRNAQTTLPGVAESLEKLLGDDGAGKVVVRQLERVHAAQEPLRDPKAAAEILPAPPEASGGDRGRVVIVPYPETNSLLLRGSLIGIQNVKRLVDELDLPRRQVELSLWIIDIKKDELDRLGVQWSGSVGVAGQLGLGFNGGYTTLDGNRFLASVSALSGRGDAAIVSRPVLLTQENVLAHFDSNSSFYARLEAERVAALETITYGTLISVMPRVSSDEEVEMQLQIEDGANTGSVVGGLPVVARTSIDTVARVPHALSLLVGGYTRQEQSADRAAIPGLGRIPLIGRAFRHRQDHRQQLVRVFLIQPRVLPIDQAGTPADFDDIRRQPSLPAQYQQLRQKIREELDDAHR